MIHKGFSSKLQLAYSPISNFDFVALKEEEIIQQILHKSMLYVIAQRPVLYFDNMVFDTDTFSLTFEMKITGNDIVLQCKLPLMQEEIEPYENSVYVEFGSHNKKWAPANTFPIKDVNAIKIYNNEGDFLIWLSPERLIHLWQHEIISATIVGDLTPFTTYFVHYVGKATDQEIWERLTGHATLQEILSIEYPLNYGSLPTHEIALLLFQVIEMESLKVASDDIEEFINSMIDTNIPNQRDVSLDAEKLLVKLLSPFYNIKKFTNYPKSTDGLYRFGFDRFIYHIAENITLKYQDRELNFNKDSSKSDLIGIKDNKEIEVINHSKSTKTDELPND